jgi:hypothetical protein
MRLFVAAALLLVGGCQTQTPQQFYAQQDQIYRQMEARRASEGRAASETLRNAEQTVRVPPNPGEIRAAQAAARRGLREPASATFDGLYIVQDKQNPRLRYLCGTVNAKNGFGGFAGPRQFYAGTDGSPLFISSGADVDYLRYSFVCEPRPT